MESVKGSMSIGAFAQATRLSARALRLYDASGLLVPARVDPDTGYRWYEPAQLAVPLEDLAAMLALELSRTAPRTPEQHDHDPTTRAGGDRSRGSAPSSTVGSLVGCCHGDPAVEGVNR